MLEAIVAVYDDWGIGAGGTQSLVLHADRRHFRELTGSDAVIVGRKTLADFPGGRPLPGRKNYVLSRTAQEVPGAIVIRSAEEALAAAADCGRAVVIGGESVYRLLLPFCDTVHVTKIHALPGSDAFFPDLDRDPDWFVAEEGDPSCENDLTYQFLTYRRRV